MNPYFDISLSSSVVAGYTIYPGTAERRLQYEQSNAHLELDPAQWELTHNPWGMLQTVSRDEIERVSADPIFRKRVDGLVQARRQEVEAPAWFQQNHYNDPGQLPVTPLRQPNGEWLANSIQTPQ